MQDVLKCFEELVAADNGMVEGAADNLTHAQLSEWRQWDPIIFEGASAVNKANSIENGYISRREAHPIWVKTKKIGNAGLVWGHMKEEIKPIDGQLYTHYMCFSYIFIIRKKMEAGSSACI